MSRRHRINAPGTIHHVVNRGVNRQRIFFTDADRVEFGRLLGEVHCRFGVSVIAYCLMDNHFHLILDCPDGHLSEAMHHLQSVLASHVNERNGRDGPLFKGRFYSALIDTDHYLVIATRYVERNALVLPGVDAPWEHRWSSVRARLGFKPGPDWLQSDRMLDYFSNSDAYAEFLCSNPATDESSVIDAGHLDQLALLMVALFADDSVRTAQIERTVLAATAQTMNELNRSVISTHLGFDDAAAFQRAIGRAERRMADEPSIATVVDELRLHLLDTAGLSTTARHAA